MLKIDHHNSTMGLEATVPIPEGSGLLRASGQGRVVGFLFYRPHGPPRTVITHLDYPGVIMESLASLPNPAEADSTVNNLSFPDALDIP